MTFNKLHKVIEIFHERNKNSAAVQFMMLHKTKKMCAIKQFKSTNGRNGNVLKRMNCMSVELY